MNERIGIVSLGCAKNQVDAEMMLFTLKQSGYKIVADPAMADVVIVNTCGFIESAKQESINEIIELGKLKAEGKIKAIIVTGCLAERYQHMVKEQLYEVDGVVGIGANEDIVKVVEKCLQGEQQELYPDKLLLPLEGGRVQSTPSHYAYLKLGDGCDNRCTYCAIPLIRGKFRSRKMETIVAEAKELAQNGVKELILIAQDVTRYGIDLYKELKLPALLDELCKIDRIKWIRLLYCYPDEITDELIDCIAKQEKVLNYIDIPLQHCNNRVLKAMNRRGTKETIVSVIDKLRKKIPDIILRTTFICGFPGETEEEFNELAEFVQEIKFQRLGCFAYSQEEDTPAADFDNQIDEEVKEKRAEIIMEQQMSIMENYCQSLVGKTIEVVCEGYDRYAECYFGRSMADSPDVDGKVFFKADGEKKPQIGEFVNVCIDDFLDCDPIGIMV
ncbi:MAG: 30S ribosomal protein S12 methylthiotransferase RimO [Acutalibacteraceae bacterium]|nr:30S ribosomal protein S12 methylthiotransferase RimO [Acutalibacteraceae bacterium]